MSTPNQSEPQDELDAILAIIRVIAEKSADGNYLYRGEPQRHRTVSSSLWRVCRKKMKTEDFDIQDIEAQILEVARKFTTEKEAIEIWAELQHYGGHTNLIDFTTDYLKALFFACDGAPDEDGRVILLQQTEAIKEEYRIEEPQSPQNRVIAQKSIFVRPPKGFIEPAQYEIIHIPKSLKESMLNHLQQYHGISPETIYNDLHGFIKNEAIHQRAYIAFYIGSTSLEKGDLENEEGTDETGTL